MAPVSDEAASIVKAPDVAGRLGRNRGEIRWPPMGRSNGHQRGDPVAAYGEISMAAVMRGCRSLFRLEVRSPAKAAVQTNRNKNSNLRTLITFTWELDLATL